MRMNTSDPRLSDVGMSDNISLVRNIVECVFLAAETFEVTDERDAIHAVLGLADTILIECREELRRRCADSIAKAGGCAYEAVGPTLTDGRLLSRLEQAYRFIECVEMAIMPMTQVEGSEALTCTLGEAYRPLADCKRELQARQSVRAAA